MQNRHEENASFSGRLTRREVLAAGLTGMAGALTASQAFSGDTAAPNRNPSQPAEENFPAKADSVILLWLSGGPSHTDTFDPKPYAGLTYTGRFDRDLPTNVPGMRIALNFPRLAYLADKYAIIRGATHGDSGHESASYKNLTGHPGRGDLSFPLTGSVVAMKKFQQGYHNALPPFVILGSPFTRVGGAGFLGRRCEPLVSSGPSMLSASILQKAEERRSLLRTLDAQGGTSEASPLRSDREGLYRQIETSRDGAYGLIVGEQRRVFDLSEESRQMQESYGMNNVGQRCLLARRLVERGVAFVAINYGGWDTHSRHFEQYENNLGPTLDRALSGLIADLDQRGMLSRTIVLCLGEFGRTPQVFMEPPWLGGRHHYGRAQSVFLAGGGFKGGAVVGETDRIGAIVTSRATYPWDLWASVYQQLGFNPNGTLPHPEGRMVRMNPVTGTNTPTGGLLTEIM